MAFATFAAGCFWGVELEFQKTAGVTSTAVGYEGGKTERPTYEEICTGTTEHAEVVQVEFDPERVTYKQLLEVFWKSHNPTQKNRQGPDVGTQYRSAIFWHDEEQRFVAEESKQQLADSGQFKSPIVTEIVPTDTFWVAEAYHQQYLQKRGRDQCHF